MITTIYINADTDPDDLRKQFRKKLMTGGAVIRLAPDFPKEGLPALVERFRANAVPNNIDSQVLRQVAARDDCPAKVLEELCSMPDRLIAQTAERTLKAKEQR